jgi:hypothetical protein
MDDPKEEIERRMEELPEEIFEELSGLCVRLLN